MSDKQRVWISRPTFPDIAANLGVAASDMADVLNESVANGARALMLGAGRRVNAAKRWLREGHWHATDFTGWLGLYVRWRALGVLGMGRIGQAVIRRAHGFGMPVTCHSRSPLPEPYERACHVGQGSHLLVLSGQASQAQRQPTIPTPNVLAS